MLQDRTLEVLRAIVQEYITSREPVGSKTLVEKHDFKVSSATIRNDMAMLEDEELISAPHTSSGRVPTDKGYRLFVDRLAQVKQLSTAERNAIESLLAGSNDLDETLGKTVRLLSRLTNQIAMVQYPTLGKSKVRSVDIIGVTENKALLILVTDIGRIEQHVVQLGSPVSADFLQSVRNRLNSKLAGQPMSEVQAGITGFENDFAAADRAKVAALLTGLRETVDANRTEKLLVSGAANLARRENDFTGSITPLLDALEEQVVLLRLIGEMQVEQHGVSLRIGRENQQEAFGETSVVVTGYETGGAEVARLGVIGPTRMDYSNNMAAVLAVAKYLTRSLEN
ncbi:MAG: hypothetical protein RLZZ400_877 [Actinomycetota bacterium]|jgi:heat-inducible transcriptional repressor